MSAPAGATCAPPIRPLARAARIPVVAAGILAAIGLVTVPALLVGQGTEAARRAAELVERLNEGIPEALAAYAADAFGGRLAQMGPPEMHGRMLSSIRTRTGGLELHGFREEEASRAVARLRALGTEEWLELHVEVEPAAPHRIVGLQLAPGEPPPGERLSGLSAEEAANLLEGYLGRLAERDAFSGAVLLARNGEVRLAVAHGEANKDFGVPNRVDTKFNLGSMNKMFTAVAIAQLAERGLLSFDDPLSKYLPGFPDPEAARAVRLEHLLTHTSGLGSYFGREFQEGSRARFRTVDDFLTLARDDSLAFPPGTRWSYSNTGFLVLGKVIEEVTGQSYFDYVREHIYAPAGMERTGSYDLDRVNPDLAVGYEREPDGGFRNNLFEHVIRGGPAGGGYSTVEDLFRFAEALKAGRLVSPAMVERLLAPKPELSSPRYGYGFGVDPERGVAGHSGGFDGISSNLEIYTEDGWVAVVLSNYGGASQPVVARMRELIDAVDR